MASNYYIPEILLPTCITSHSRTLIDNIFTSYLLPDCISGNLTCTVSDHLPQIMVIPHIFNSTNNIKSKIFCEKMD